MTEFKFSGEQELRIMIHRTQPCNFVPHLTSFENSENGRLATNVGFQSGAYLSFLLKASSVEKPNLVQYNLFTTMTSVSTSVIWPRHEIETEGISTSTH